MTVSCDKTEDINKRIQGMAEMSELGTVEYTIKKIIKADDAIWYKYGDRKILYQSTACLKAGIDMSGFKTEDVKLGKGKSTISVTLKSMTYAKVNQLKIDNLCQFSTNFQYLSEATAERSELTVFITFF